MKRILTILMVLCLVLSLSISTAAANGQQHDYSTASNSGIRHEICTSLLGTSADDYYTGNYTYEKLSQLDKATLLTTLRTLMTTTHTKETSYDDCKFQATKTDCQNNDGSIVTIYTSYAAQFSDFKNGTGWNREHVWPKSLGGFKNNGAGADLHHIRPSENRTNSNRGNLKYGNVTGGKNSSGNLSGELGGAYNGTFYEPVDSAKGDVARICLYVYVRYGGDLSKCSNITNVFESIDVLLEWCALDPVDTWEMGRNEVVGAIQGNRNVFIDYPELAWNLFGKDVPAGMTTPSGNASGSTPHTHKYTASITTPATCKNEGVKTYTCSCGDRYTEAISKSAHNYSATVKAPTCADKGYTTYTCTVCSDSYQADHTPATGVHKFGAWVMGDGVKSRTCSVCSYQETEQLPTTEPTTKPTDPPTEPTEPATKPTNPPTEPSEPSTKPTEPAQCPHANVIHRNKKDATCTRDGYTGDTYCIDCGRRIVTGTVIPAKGHVNKNQDNRCDTCGVALDCAHAKTHTENAKAATCGEDGYSGDTVCSACGDVITQGQQIPATGEHRFGQWETIENAMIRTCSVCSHQETQTIEPTRPSDPTAEPSTSPSTEPATQPATQPSTVPETQPTVTQPGTTAPTQAPSSAPTDAPTEPAEEPKNGFPTGPVIAVIGIPAIGAGLFVGLKKKKRDQ